MAARVVVVCGGKGGPGAATLVKVATADEVVHVAQLLHPVLGLADQPLADAPPGANLDKLRRRMHQPLMRHADRNGGCLDPRLAIGVEVLPQVGWGPTLVFVHSGHLWKGQTVGGWRTSRCGGGRPG
jgi:hypothetical protein